MSRRTEEPTRQSWLGPRLRSLGGVALGLVLGVALTLGGLAQAGKLQPPQDPEVLVALAQLLETEHLRVDLMLEQEDVGGAMKALEALTETEWPSRTLGGDASLLLRHDLYGRLLRLRLDHPDVDPLPSERLLSLVDEGLGREWEQLDANPFTARLLGLRGEVLETLDCDDEALAAYEAALGMNRTVLDELMKDAP